ncbi:MAG: DUF1501 domain-containing protein [Bacteroidota bacterium]
MKRRDFFKLSGSVALGSGFGPLGVGAYSQVSNPMANLLLGMEESDRVLVMVFLNGGNDGLNTLVPLDYLSQLNAARPNIMQPDNSLIELPGTGLGMHSAMGKMKELYDEEKLLIVQNVGYDNPNFSHFRSTDIWMSGSDSNQVINSGWTGRYMNNEYPNYPFGYPNPENPHPLAIEIGNTSSLLFQGPDTKMGMSITDPKFFYDLIENIEPPVPAGRAGERIELIRVLQKQSEQYNLRVKEAAEKVPTQKAYPNHNLAAQLKIVSQLIAGGLQTKLYLVQLRGFDTHASQVVPGNPTQGDHSYLLKDVSESIGAFVDDMEFLGTQDRVLGMVFSEFGRRIRGNFSNGSDHGTAGPMFLFGSPVQKGIIGSNPVIPDTVNPWDNLEHEFDYRQVYASVFEQWFCVPREEMEDTLLRGFETLSLVQPSLSCNLATSDKSRLDGEAGIRLFPSPAKDRITVEFLSGGESIHMDIIGLDGRLVQQHPWQRYPLGVQSLQLDISQLTAGHYFLRIHTRGGAVSQKFVKLP